jgi:uncharacterized Fe-S cluster-containing protein
LLYKFKSTFRTNTQALNRFPGKIGQIESSAYLKEMTEKKKKKMIYVLDIYQSRSLRIVPSPSTFEQISGKTRRVKFLRL